MGAHGIVPDVQENWSVGLPESVHVMVVNGLKKLLV